MPRLDSIRIYPIKSCAPLHQSEAEVRPRGLADDRRLMLVDRQGRFVTGRECPQLTRIEVEPTAAGWRLKTAGKPPIDLGEAGSERQSVNIWKDEVDARMYSSEVGHWLSDVLGHDVTLVRMDGISRRPVDADFSEPGDEVSFADGYPLLLISRQAVTALNERLRSPVKMANFRPNLVVDDCPAHAEDDWRRIRIGMIEFDIVKPCARCVFTTVDPATGRKRDDVEPLRTLATYRRINGKVVFGQNVIARGVGTIRAGDEVEVLK